MSNLKPLAWNKDGKSWTAYGAGISYTITEFDGVATVSWHNMVKSAKDLPFSSDKKTLLSYSEALDFVEKEHYPHFMNEFVKPSPTWIDAKKQLPQVDRDTQFICAYDSALEPFSKVAWFNADIGEFNYEHDSVLAWMPIPEFSTMQNNKGE